MTLRVHNASRAHAAEPPYATMQKQGLFLLDEQRIAAELGSATSLLLHLDTSHRASSHIWALRYSLRLISSPVPCFVRQDKMSPLEVKSLSEKERGGGNVMQVRLKMNEGRNYD